MSQRFISPKAIERIASEARERAGLPNSESHSVDVIALAVAFGCAVRYVDFDPNEVSARVRRNPDEDSWDDYLIEINASEVVARQRFSIAHELAHVLLHGEDTAFDFVEYRAPLSSYAEPNALYKEVQANMLAAALLMPSGTVRQFWQRNDDIDDLARAFNVSRDSAYWRVNNLGLMDA